MISSSRIWKSSRVCRAPKPIAVVQDSHTQDERILFFVKYYQDSARVSMFILPLSLHRSRLLSITNAEMKTPWSVLECVLLLAHDAEAWTNSIITFGKPSDVLIIYSSGGWTYLSLLLPQGSILPSLLNLYAGYSEQVATGVMQG